MSAVKRADFRSGLWPGLPQGKLPKPGERSAEHHAGNAPGIGLGLELCRRLAKAMGG